MVGYETRKKRDVLPPYVKWIVLSLLVLLLAGAGLEASERWIEVRPNQEEAFLVLPRSVVATTFRVTNKGTERREFVPEIRLPPGWIPLTKGFPFELDASASDIHFVSFFVPQSALAGAYEVTYLVEDREVPSMSDAYTILVRVIPLIRIKAEVLHSPEYVIAGHEYRAAFAVTNESNVEANVRIMVNCSDDLPMTVDVNQLKLGAGEAGEVMVTGVTERETASRTKVNMHLVAEVIEDPNVRVHALASAEIVPRISLHNDRYHRIPGEITLRWATEQEGEDTTGFQADISGRGSIDEAGVHQVEYHMTVPDHGYESIYSDYDEYLFGYRTSGHEVYLGDRVFSLSPLTENYLYGRGIMGNRSDGRFTLSAYHMKTRRLIPERQQTAGHVGYAFRENQHIALNYLHKGEDGGEGEGIVSLHGISKPMKDMDVEAEYGTTGSDHAYLLKCSGYRTRTFYHLKFIHADPDFKGYYKDADMFSTGFTLSLSDQLSLNAYFRRDLNNLDKDPNRGSSFRDTAHGLGLKFRPTRQVDLSLDWRYHERTDRLPSPVSDYRENGVSIGMWYNLARMNLFSSAEFRRTGDRLDDRAVGSQHYMLSAFFRPTDAFTCKGYLYWDSDKEVSGIPRNRMTTGVGMHYRLLKRTSLNLNYQVNEYRESDDGREFLEIIVDHVNKNRTRLSALGRHIAYGEPGRNDETLVMLEYTIPFGLPIKRRRDIGGIKGEIFSNEMGEGVPNIVLNLSGADAVTDRRGRFFFPSVQPGDLYLGLDRTGLDPNTIPMVKMPMSVSVEGGKDTLVEIPMIRSASLAGQVLLYTWEGDEVLFNKEQKLVEKDGLENVVVELTNGSDTHRCLTGSHGRFSFEDLKPGTWTLTIPISYLPQYHYVEHGGDTFELAPGQKRSMSVRILPRDRRIKFIQQGGTVTEEGSSQ
ncbi:MAG: hypothetical protein ACMUIL_02820 [bacterium]